MNTNWEQHKNKSRKASVALANLNTGDDCFAIHLQRINIYISTEYNICQEPNSEWTKNTSTMKNYMQTESIKNIQSTIPGCQKSDKLESKLAMNNNNIDYYNNENFAVGTWCVFILQCFNFSEQTSC